MTISLKIEDSGLVARRMRYARHRLVGHVRYRSGKTFSQNGKPKEFLELLL
jgi:hypothetical protein